METDQKPYALFALGIVLILGVIYMSYYTFFKGPTQQAATTVQTTGNPNGNVVIVPPPVETPVSALR
jgi:hypothetical protein